MFSLLVSAYISILSLPGYTQKVPLFDLESPTRSSADFFSNDSSNFCCIYSWIWVSRNLGPHLETGSNFTPWFSPDFDQSCSLNINYFFHLIYKILFFLGFLLLFQILIPDTVVKYYLMNVYLLFLSALCTNSLV